MEKNKNAVNKKDKNHYRLPVPKDSLLRIDRTSSPAHKGKLRNAIDLIVPENTPVLAAADGIVSFVKDDSNIGGPSPIYLMYTNFVAIMHTNGQYSRYDHLAYHSSKVSVGQRVYKGQEIAKVGMTGYTILPHLHFQVFVFTGNDLWKDFDTLPIQDFDP
jgi:murein DD-endopeptidase MepM/ murein hydrolase activator NlpD